MAIEFVPIEDERHKLQAEELVIDGWNTTMQFALDAYNSANGFLTNMEEIGLQVAEIPDISVELGNVDKVIRSLELPDDPDEPTGFDANFPDAPIDPVLTDVDPLNLPDAPAFSDTPPAIDLNIDAPDDLTAQPPTAPDLETVVLPTEPSEALPVVPTLENLALPSEPVLELPTFVATLGDAPDAPNTEFTFTEDTYASDLLTSLRTTLQSFLDGAATGLDPDVEQAIWDRAREREDANSMRVGDEIRRSFASRGFELPQGAMATALMEAAQSTAQTNSGLSRDVAIKQAELEQQNRQFSITASQQVESGLIQYTSQVAQRSFEAARFAAQIVVDVFNANINRYNAQVQAFNVEAQVFRVLTEQALAQLEIYRSKIEAQSLIGQINGQNLEIYKTQLEGVKTLADVYRSKVDAARAKSEVNKSITDKFLAEVRAYGEIVNAKGGEYDAYATRVGAEAKKADVFKAQADAFNAQVNAYRSTVDAKVAEKNAEIRINQEVPLETFRTKVQAFGEQVRGETGRIQGLGELLRGRVATYDTKVRGATAQTQADVSEFEALADLKTREAALAIQEAQANIQTLLASTDLLSQTLKAGSQVSSQLAASALSAVNVSGSIGSSASSSNSAIQSSSKSQSTNYNYNYNSG
jgi:hypothetical protein